MANAKQMKVRNKACIPPRDLNSTYLMSSPIIRVTIVCESVVCHTRGFRMPSNNRVILNGTTFEGATNGCKKPQQNGTARQLVQFASLPSRPQHEKFLRDTIEILLNDAVFNGTNRQNPLLEWHNPEELKQLIDFQLTGSCPLSHVELLEIIRKIIKYSVKVGHPYFVNQLFSTVDPYGLVGQWLTDSLNPTVYTYEVAPVFTLMEQTVLKEMRQLVGFPKGDGIFCPGGSLANAYAISCARHKFMPEIKRKGLCSLPRLVLFTSEEAHYSLKKMASFMGLGTDNVYLVKTDCRGKMCVGHLEEMIQKSLKEKAVPFMVCATAGTTVLGAFDPLVQVGNVCHKFGLWMHVDAAWGGGALVSPKYRYLLKGIERADSVTWNPHKLLCAPQQCSTLLLRHENLLTEAHSTQAAYLFQKDKFYDTSYDTGDKHIQCGRRADVLKFWLMWKAKGTSGLQEHVEKVFEIAQLFTDSIRKRPGFQLIVEEPEFLNICFWYIPPSLRGLDDSDEFRQKLHKIAPKIKERMMKEGSMMVTYQPQKDNVNFFRIVFQNSGLEAIDVEHFISEFERLGCDL